MDRGDPAIWVSEPGPGDAGCWALKRRYSGSLWSAATNCGHKARPGHLTCASHAALEAAAQQLKGGR